MSLVEWRRVAYRSVNFGLILGAGFLSSMLACQPSQPFVLNKIAALSNELKIDETVGAAVAISPQSSFGYYWKAKY